MGRMAAALRRLGFRYIFATNFTADLTIMEEGSEFFVWISDDGNKVPVFLESPLRVGSVRARLVEYGGLMYDSGAL